MLASQLSEYLYCVAIADNAKIQNYPTYEITLVYLTSDTMHTYNDANSPPPQPSHFYHECRVSKQLIS